MPLLRSWGFTDSIFYKYVAATWLEELVQPDFLALPMGGKSLTCRTRLLIDLQARLNSRHQHRQAISPLIAHCLLFRPGKLKVAATSRLRTWKHERPILGVMISIDQCEHCVMHVPFLHPTGNVQEIEFDRFAVRRYL